jgi:hypothetical protein
LFLTANEGVTENKTHAYKLFMKKVTIDSEEVPFLEIMAV